jgi:dTDP-4-dehydrorhamnose reductase
MRVLILGASGMLGHRLMLDWQQKYDVWGTVRGSASRLPIDIERGHIIEDVDVLRFDSVVEAVEQVAPDVVINCIGIIKQRDEAKQTKLAIEINALFPHRLAHFCHAARTRLILISTDCVFSGQKGNYTESDPTDPLDNYGKTKSLGEVAEIPGCVTIRSSIIGHELGTQYGLIEWFLAQNNPIKGYTRAIYTGFPTKTFAKILDQYVLRSDLEGLWQVSSDPISKYELLHIVKRVYGRTIEIIPDSDVMIDRSLNSMRFRERTGYMPAPWETMIKEMVADAS